MARAKERVDDLTALREATREAHEAIQSLNETRKAAADERERLEHAKQELADMVAALWDAKMDAVIEEALAQYLPSIAALISATEETVTKRIDRLLDVMLNPKESEVATVIEELYGDKGAKEMSAVEQIIFNSTEIVQNRQKGLL